MYCIYIYMYIHIHAHTHFGFTSFPHHQTPEHNKHSHGALSQSHLLRHVPHHLPQLAPWPGAASTDSQQIPALGPAMLQGTQGTQQLRRKGVADGWLQQRICQKWNMCEAIKATKTPQKRLALQNDFSTKDCHCWVPCVCIFMSNKLVRLTIRWSVLISLKNHKKLPKKHHQPSNAMSLEGPLAVVVAAGCSSCTSHVSAQHSAQLCGHSIPAPPLPATLRASATPGLGASTDRCFQRPGVGAGSRKKTTVSMDPQIVSPFSSFFTIQPANVVVNHGSPRSDVAESCAQKAPTCCAQCSSCFSSSPIGVPHLSFMGPKPRVPPQVLEIVCICIYVFMYLCIYVSMYLCIYVSMYLCMSVCLFVCR